MFFLYVDNFLSMTFCLFEPNTAQFKNTYIHKKIMQITNKQEIFCNKCSSVDLKYLFQCPVCYVEDFDKVKLIEHYNCGNISPGFEYKNNLCPKCDGEITDLGTDYKVIYNTLLCSSCLEMFSEPMLNIECRKCQNLFQLEENKNISK